MKRLDEIREILTSIPLTVVSGVFLLGSFLLSHVILPQFGMTFPLYLDPAWLSVAISGVPLLYLAIKRVFKNRGIRKISSALLISVAMIAAIAIGDLFAAGEVAFIMAVGEILEDKTTDRAKRGLAKLISLTPETARRITEEGEETVAVESVAVGDVLRILPGERVPVDGVILFGETALDQSVMTGESLPVDKAVGDEVYSGTVNQHGAIDIRASRVGEDSSLQKLIRMVKEAEEKQAPTQRIADTWASFLVPAAFLLAVIAGLVRQDIVAAVTVLVVFCPCALVLATPTAIMAAIGQATKKGVVIKSGEALERLGKADVIAFDKTGTLTHGTLAVTDVIPLAKDISEGDLLALAATAESYSEHPLGKAVAEHAKEKGLLSHSVTDFRMEAGMGVCATYRGGAILCGNEGYLAKNGIQTDAARAHLEALYAEGKAAMLVGHNGALCGVIALADTLREDARETVARLHAAKLKSVLLTGDNRRAAEYLASQVGIDRVEAELLPEGKVAAIERMKENACVCMVGDGVNDAPALKTADVGVAPARVGSDIAVEAADVVLVGDDMSRLPYLCRLARATMRTIRFGISLSLLINLAAIVLSFLGVLNPTLGALVHNAGSVLVVLIAALLYDRKFEK